MCYNLKYLTESQLKLAIREGANEDDIIFLREELNKYRKFFNVSGFEHPELPIYTNVNPLKPIKAVWGLIPHWAKDKDIWNQTINARSETIFEKPAFRDAAKKNRCLIVIDGFYEHHHLNGKTYPFFIYRKDGLPFTVAALYSDYLDKSTGELLKTFSIVTTTANKLMTKIHNNPKAQEPRMPLILPDELQSIWLNTNNQEAEIKQLCLPFPDELIESHTVRKLKGKESPGNVPEASDKFIYAELTDNKLF